MGGEPSAGIDLVDLVVRVPRADVERLAQAVAPTTTLPLLLLRALRARRERAEAFPDLPLAEPVWSIFLELYLARLEQRRMSISDLCHASGVPRTTAMRYIDFLEARGHVVREADRNDGRRTFVRLASATEKLVAWLFNRSVGL